MAKRSYKLDFQINAAQAEAAARRVIAGLGQVEQAAARAASATQRAYSGAGAGAGSGTGAGGGATGSQQATQAAASASQKNSRLAAIEDAYLRRDYSQRVAYERRKSMAAEREAERGAAASVAAKNREAAQLQSLQDRMLTREYSQRVSYEKKKELEAARVAKAEERLRLKSLTDEQVALKVRNESVRRGNQERIDAGMKAAGLEKKGFLSSIADATGLSTAMTGVGVAMLGISAGRAILDGIGDAMARVAQKAKELGIKLIEDEDALRPLASVMGVKPDAAFAKANAEFGVETGLKPQETKTFRETFRGRAQITRGKQIDDKGFDDFEKMAGKITAAKGIPEAVAGELFGSVLKVENFKAKGQGAKEAAARALGTLKILDAGSGRMEALVPQLNQLMTSMTAEGELEGVFRNSEETGVALSTAAEFDPNQAAILVQRTSHGLRDFQNKEKKKFFKRAKITDKDSYLEAVKKANDVIEEEVAKGVPVDQAIEKMGFTEIRENRGMKTNFLARKTVLEPQLKNLEQVMSPEAVADSEKQLAELEKTDVMKSRREKAGEHLVDVKKAGDQTKVDILHQQSENMLREGEDGLDSTSNSIYQKFMDIPTYAARKIGFMSSSRDNQIAAGMRYKLAERAGELEEYSPGISEKVAGMVQPGFQTSTTEGFNRQFSSAIEMLDQIEAEKNGTSGGGENGAKMLEGQEETNRLLREQNDLLKAQGRGNNIVGQPAPAAMGRP